MRNAVRPASSFDAFFEAYVNSCNQALGDSPDIEGVRGFFADHFTAPRAPGGEHGGDSFLASLREGFRFRRAIGAQALNLRKLESTPVDSGYAMAKAFYRAEYRRDAREPLSIDFEVTYLLEASGETPKILAFVGGDEMERHRRCGQAGDEGVAA